MPTISQKVASLAKRISPEAADCYSGNIKYNIDVITQAKGGEVTNSGVIATALNDLEISLAVENDSEPNENDVDPNA